MSPLELSSATRAISRNRIGAGDTAIPLNAVDDRCRPLNKQSALVKQIQDYVLGGLIAIAIAPVAAVIALAIKLESRGPVFFIQRRHGLSKKIIRVFKFRSMTVLEDGEHIAQATADDERITRVGRFLRRTSLDELPQLINVLRGEMSLVGPRPHAIAHDRLWRDMLDQYDDRFQIKPGITGLAQIKGLRGEVDTPDKIERRLAEDLNYIKTWSPGLDIKILILTIAAMFTGKNAH